MTSEAQSIQAAMPSDNDLRIGVVETAYPLMVQFQQGQSVPCGKLASYIPVVGQTVAVLRQDATWLCLGTTDLTIGKQLSQEYYVQCNLALSLTTTVTDVSNCTVTFFVNSTNATIVAQWTGDFESIGTTQTLGVLSLYLDGTPIAGAPQALFSNAGVNGNRATPGQQYMFTPNTGTRTLTLRGNRAGGADAMLRLNSVHTTLLVQVYE